MATLTYTNLDEDVAEASLTAAIHAVAGARSAALTDDDVVQVIAHLNEAGVVLCSETLVP